MTFLVIACLMEITLRTYAVYFHVIMTPLGYWKTQFALHELFALKKRRYVIFHTLSARQKTTYAVLHITNCTVLSLDRACFPRHGKQLITAVYESKPWRQARIRRHANVTHK